MQIPMETERKLYGKQLSEIDAKLAVAQKELEKLEFHKSTVMTEIKKLPACILANVVADVRFNDKKRGVSVPDGTYFYEQMEGGGVLVHCPKQNVSYGIPAGFWETAITQYRVNLL